LLELTNLVYVAVHNSHNLHSTITEKLQKYTDLIEELIRIWQLKTSCKIPLVLSTTGITPNKLHEMFVLKLLKTLQHVSIIIQIIFRELLCPLLKSLILKFVKNVKSQCGDAAA